MAALFLGGTAFGAQVGAWPQQKQAPVAGTTRGAPSNTRTHLCLSTFQSPQISPQILPPSSAPPKGSEGFSCPLRPRQLGGLIGDWAAKRYPNHGRVAVAQLSVGLGVPLSAAMFKVRLAWVETGILHWAELGQSVQCPDAR